MIPVGANRVNADRRWYGLAESSFLGSCVGSVYAAVLICAYPGIGHADVAELVKTGAIIFLVVMMISFPFILIGAILAGPPIISLLKCHSRQMVVLYTIAGGIVSLLAALILGVASLFIFRPDFNDLISAALPLSAASTIFVSYGAATGFFTAMVRKRAATLQERERFLSENPLP